MNTPIRVLHVVTQMNRAGMESRIMDLYRNIDRTKIQFDFYTCRLEKGSFDEEIKELGGRIFYNEPLSIYQILSIPERFKLFFLKNKNYKIVHCHMNQWSGFILKGAYLANIPIRISHSRTALSKKNFKNFSKNLIKLPVNKYATHKLAVSKKAGEWLYGKNSMRNSEVIIVPNAINTEEFIFNEDARNKTRKELGLDNQFVIVHLGNLRPEKNHSFLIDIFNEIKIFKPNSKLLIIGQDNMNGIIQKKAKDTGNSKDILFLGSQVNVSNFLFASDFFVFPSLYEGFPGAVLEAQATGLPALISNTITEEVIILPSTKSMPITDSAKSWANKILNIPQINRMDSVRMIKDAGYDIEIVSTKIVEFYNKLIKNNEKG